MLTAKTPTRWRGAWTGQCFASCSPSLKLDGNLSVPQVNIYKVSLTLDAIVTIQNFSPLSLAYILFSRNIARRINYRKESGERVHRCLVYVV